MTRIVFAVAAASLVAWNSVGAVAQAYPEDKYVEPSSPLVRVKIEWFRDQKLCLMMHFGLYSIFS